MIRAALALADLLAGAIRRAGIDYPQFRAILETKLTIDNRRPAVQFAPKRDGSPRNMFTFALAMNAFMGFFIALLLGVVDSPMAGMTIVNSFVMVMLAMTLIADFSNVLLDTTDNAIMQPRPVDSRTLLAARLAHIIWYLGVLSLSLSAGALVLGTFFINPLFPLVQLAVLVCAVALVVFFVSVFYLLTMRIVGGERFRDIITYIQIGLSIVFIAGYQMAPRLLDMSGVRKLSITHHWWIYIYPPAWLAAPADLVDGRVGSVQLVLTGLGLVMPAIGMYLVVRVLAPGFGAALSGLDVTATRPERAGGDAPRALRPSRLSRLVARSPIERAGFELVRSISARDRQFKLRTYPMFGMAIVMGIAFMFQMGSRSEASFSRMTSGGVYLLPLYMNCLFVLPVIAQLRFSEGHEAAWIYAALPVERPGAILSGALKALLVRLIGPAYCLFAGFVLVLRGPSVLPDVFLAGSATLLFTALTALAFGRKLPFSEPMRVKQTAGAAIFSMLLMIVVAAFGFGHFAMTTLAPRSVWLATPVVLVLAAVVMAAYRRVTWQEVLKSE